MSSSTRCSTTSVSASSLPKPQLITAHQDTSIAYERPWDTLQTSLISSLSSPSSATPNRNGGSLQKMPSTEESKQIGTPPFPMVSPNISTCRHSTCSPDEKNTINNLNVGGK